MAVVRPLKPRLKVSRELARAVTRERADFDHVYDTLVAAFTLGKPDARSRANALRRAYVTMVRQLKTVRFPSKRQRATLLVVEDRLARLGDLLNRTRGRKSNSTDSGPTPETVVQQHRAHDLRSLSAYREEGFTRSNGDSLKRLRANGVIDADEEKAGRQIASIFEAVTRGMGAKAGSLERGLGGGTWRISDRLAVLHQDRYRPWAEQTLRRLGAPGLEMAIAVTVDGESLRRASRRQRIGYVRAQRVIKHALSLYVQRQRATRWAEDPEYLAERIGAEELALLESGILPGAKP